MKGPPPKIPDTRWGRKKQLEDRFEVDNTQKHIETCKKNKRNRKKKNHGN